MKNLIGFILAIAGIFTTAAQENPRLVGIQMIGKTEKPIFGLFIVDSTKEKEFINDPQQSDLVYADSSTIEKIYLIFKDAKQHDFSKKYDYSFGTFQFNFRVGDQKKYFVGSRVQSAVYLQKIICRMSPDDKTEREIVDKINGILERINY